MRAAAEQSGVGLHCADELVQHWGELPPWPETVSVLGNLARRTPLGVATNCSIELGRRAVARCGVAFAVVVTAEEAGFYKPLPEPYRAVLRKLANRARAHVVCSGSAADVPGAKGVGMPVYWHNRMGLAPIGDAIPEYVERSLHAALGDRVMLEPPGPRQSLLTLETPRLILDLDRLERNCAAMRAIAALRSASRCGRT